MRVTLSDREPTELTADALIVVFHAPARGRLHPPLAEHLRVDAAKLIGRKAESLTWLETRSLATPRVLLYCLGPEPRRWNDADEYLGGHAGSLDHRGLALRSSRALRNAGAQIERACHGLSLRHVVLARWPDGCDPGLLVEGFLLRGHDPRAWDAEPHEESSSVRRLSVAMRNRGPSEVRAMRELLVAVDATNFARVLGDLPSNMSMPAQLVARVRERFAGLPVEVRTISASEAKAIGMGLFTAVDAGAGERGCILILEHRPKPRGHDSEDELPLLALLGKGLIHDTGGYNIKTTSTLHELTHDKCGATAVIGAMLAIAQLDLAVRVMAVCPLTENCIDAHAYKPGDVLRAFDGTTVYVENTDAEGRLVLADALAWLAQFEPALAVDLATLTASVHATLGDPFAALYCNEDRVRELLTDAGHTTGDLLWPLPIHELHERDLGHHKADLRNIGMHAGNPSSAAAFLRHFAEFPWAHVDLAGKAHTEYGREYHGPGATGFGTRLLIELARRFSDAVKAE